MYRRRVLTIAHHFPPASGSGSNRALAFVRYLPEYGWEPVVVTPGAAWASPRDDGLLSQLPPDLHVVRTRSFEPKPRTVQTLATSRKSPGKSNVIRSSVGHLKRFPDAHIGWLPFALAAARRQKYDVAYSTSGPFTSHLVGLLLKKLTGRPWVAELRDGWSRWNRAIFPDYPAWRGVLERRLESVALRTADRVILVTGRMADAFCCQYPDLPPDHFVVVSNGYDPLQFGVAPGRPPSDESWFNVLHSGALYYGRSMVAFLEATQRVCDADRAFAQAFRLTLLGTLDAAAGREVIGHPLGERITAPGQVDHAAAVAAMRQADVLLLVANTTPGAEATVPGKLFEYLAVGRPVLAIAPPESATADVLRQTGGGWLAPAGDPEAIACALQRAFDEYNRGVSSVADRAQLSRFDRRQLTGELAHIFERVA